MQDSRRNDDIESAMKFMRDLQDFLTLYMQILRRQCKRDDECKDTMKDASDAVSKNSKKGSCLSVHFGTRR